MNKRIKEIHILHVNLPLRRKFRHALASRCESDSIFVKADLCDGPAGYGESLPREYVTGETPRSVISDLRNAAERNLFKFSPANYRDVAAFMNSLPIGGAARCALELALLDAYGKYFNSSVSSVIGRGKGTRFSYSGVIHAGSTADAAKTALAFKIFGLRFIKLKVGVENDIARLRAVRKIAGSDADIRVDANCAWSADEAIEKIGALREYGISAVEQPVGANDYEGLRKVTREAFEPIIADESLRTIGDARRLIRLNACTIFNIRVSKCGGLFNSSAIADIAQSNNIGIQLGCQVGESGILSAAGWHFASSLGKIDFCEGAYGRYLLKEDITQEDMTIKRGGIVEPIKGPGLGINVAENILNKYVVSEEIIKR